MFQITANTSDVYSLNKSRSTLIKSNYHDGRENHFEFDFAEVTGISALVCLPQSCRDIFTLLECYFYSVNSHLKYSL